MKTLKLKDLRTNKITISERYTSNEDRVHIMAIFRTIQSTHKGRYIILEE